MQRARIMHAVRSQAVNEVKSILEAGTLPDATAEDSGESALAIAASIGSAEIVQMLLDEGADPNYLGTILWPLTAAAGAGHIDVVEQLLLADADVEAVDEDGVTALGSAAAGGHLGVVEMLLEAGANPKHQDRYGNVAVSYAIDNSHEDVTTVLLPFCSEKLSRRLELRRKFAQQVFSSEALREFADAAMTGNDELLKKKMQEGMPVDVLLSDEADTALLWSANRGQLRTVELLLDYGADVNHQNEYGDTALSMAAKSGQGRVYDLLYRLTARKYRSRAEKFKAAIFERRQWKE